MKLNERLRDVYEYDGKEYQINLMFDNVLDMFDILHDNELSEYDQAKINLLYLFDGEHLDMERATVKNEHVIEVWNDIFETIIYQDDKAFIPRDLEGNPMPQPESKILIDIAKDAEMIFSSFQQAYCINLIQEQGKMHWHEFKALLNGLPENTIFKRVVQIRAWEPSKDESKEYKKHMQELQDIFSLEEPGQEVE